MEVPPAGGAATLKYFLIVYDRARRQLLQADEFSDRRIALLKRFELEVRERDNQNIEVVVLGATSREALERTHGRYFRTFGEIASAAGA